MGESRQVQVSPKIFSPALTHLWAPDRDLLSGLLSIDLAHSPLNLSMSAETSPLASHPSDVSQLPDWRLWDSFVQAPSLSNTTGSSSPGLSSVDRELGGFDIWSPPTNAEEYVSFMKYSPTTNLYSRWHAWQRFLNSGS